jgi:uncharacterized protein YbbC (DUF1343 family)
VIILLYILLLAGPLYANPHDIPSPLPRKHHSSTPKTSPLPIVAAIPAPIVPTTASPTFQLGIERLRAQGFAPLLGKRVGLLTHAAAVDSQGVSSIDILYKAPEVKLVALYAAEHGLEGQLKAEVKFDHATHEATGLPVYSLYGPTRKPTPDMIKQIDIMVVDMQDIGVRSYTYVSAMKLTMEACFEANIPVVILDRPNPLGGLKVDGPLLDPKYESYVGKYRIPYVHGLTIGELGRVAAEELLPLRGQLTVIPMTGWRRGMLWSDTPLRWRATSPAIPTVGAAFGYACTGLGAQLGGFRHGYGTEYPFRLLMHPRISPSQLKARLDRERLPGFAFIVMKIPAPLRGAGTEGVYVKITDWTSASPIALSLTMLQIAQEVAGADAFAKATRNESDLFNKHWGRAEPLDSLKQGKLRAAPLARHWQAEALRWQQSSQRYWIYR